MFEYKSKSKFKSKTKQVSYKILGVFCSIVVTFFGVYFFVHAGNIDSPALPSNDSGRMYTLEQIYQNLHSGTTATKQSGGFAEPGSAPGSTMHTLDNIYGDFTTDITATSGTVAANVLSGKTFFATSGTARGTSWGPVAGTMANCSSEGGNACYANSGYWTATAGDNVSVTSSTPASIPNGYYSSKTCSAALTGGTGLAAAVGQILSGYSAYASNGVAINGTATAGYAYGDSVQSTVLTTAAGVGTYNVSNLSNSVILSGTTWGVNLGSTGTMPPGSGLATGQTTSYQTNDDGTYQKGLALAYTDNSDGTITDNNTKLMWVKEMPRIIPGAVGVQAQNQIQDANAKGAWATATAYSAADLVNAIEMEAGAITASRSTTTVTASSAAFSSADLGREVFINGVSQGYVRVYTNSTTVTVSGSGTTGSAALSIKSYYVCTVDHTSGGTTFTADITANPTYWRETIWTISAVNPLTSAANPAMRWDTQAIINCENLTYAGYSDWRLPNIKELFNIVVEDAGLTAPYINHTAFPNTVSGNYWSSTTAPNLTTYTFFVYFNNGGVSTNSKTTAYYVRCVRGQ